MKCISRFVGMLVVAPLIASCVSPEYLAVRGECEVQANRQYPPKLESRLTAKNELVSVGDGNHTCTTQYKRQWPTGQVERARTTCTEGTKLINRPYSTTETVDLNRGLREEYINQCRASTCLQRYGNYSCEKPEPILNCQSDADCHYGQSCRSRSGGGTECRAITGGIVIGCQTDLDCKEGDSCRSKKGGGTECRPITRSIAPLKY